MPAPRRLQLLNFFNFSVARALATISSMFTPARSTMPGKSNLDPYTAFRNDRERRNALVSRDVRLVLVALIVALVPHAVATWWS